MQPKRERLDRETKTIFGDLLFLLRVAHCLIQNCMGDALRY